MRDAPLEEGTLRDSGIRPGFWITVIAAIVMLILVLLRYWEWAVVVLVAVLVLNRLPFVRWL